MGELQRKSRVSSRYRGGAFTLIELLVVISIIALLIGILVPVLSTAREAGRNAQCLANVKSFGSFIGIYTNDFDNHMYPSGFRDRSNNDVSWQMYLYAAYDWGSPKSFGCPSVPKGKLYSPDGSPAALNSGRSNIDRVGYVMNTMRPDDSAAVFYTGANNVRPNTWPSTPTGDQTEAYRGWTSVNVGDPEYSDWYRYPLRMDLTSRGHSESIVITDHRFTYYEEEDYDQAAVIDAFRDGVYRMGETDHSSERTASGGTPRMKVGAATHFRSEGDGTGDPVGRFNVVFADGHGKSMEESDPFSWIVKDN